MSYITKVTVKEENGVPITTKYTKLPVSKEVFLQERVNERDPRTHTVADAIEDGVNGRVELRKVCDEK